jgi:hypothetical protein
MFYQTEAITTDQFKNLLIRWTYVGWEFRIDHGVVYLRKHISGEINIKSKGWVNVL